LLVSVSGLLLVSSQPDGKGGDGKGGPAGKGKIHGCVHQKEESDCVDKGEIADGSHGCVWCCSSEQCYDDKDEADADQCDKTIQHGGQCKAPAPAKAPPPPKKEHAAAPAAPTHTPSNLNKLLWAVCVILCIFVLGMACYDWRMRRAGASLDWISLFTRPESSLDGYRVSPWFLLACSIAMLGGITWELGATKGLHPLSQMIWTLVVFLVVGVIAWSIYDYRQRTQPTYASRDDVKMAMIDRVHHGHWPFTLAVFMAVTIILLYMLIDQKHLSELSQLLYVVIVLLAFIVVAWAVFDSRTKGSSTTYVPIAEIDSYAMSVNRPADDDDEFKRRTAAKAKEYAQVRMNEERDRLNAEEAERRRAEEADLRAKEEFARRQKQEVERRTREEAQRKAREEIAARKARRESESKELPDDAYVPLGAEI